MPLPTIPSADIVLRQALLAQSVLTATAVGQMIRTRRPSPWPAQPVIVLTVIDEVELRPECNRCRVQADLFGRGTEADDYDEVKNLAPILQSVSRDCDGNWAAGKIRKCSAPNRLPSPEASGRPRIIVDFELDVTP